MAVWLKVHWFADYTARFAVVGGLFAFGFAWLSRISRVTEPERVLGVVAAEPAQRSEVGS